MNLNYILLYFNYLTIKNKYEFIINKEKLLESHLEYDSYE
jgi:hypothetical protein